MAKLLVNTRLAIARLSPISYIQRTILRKRRSRAIIKSLQEQLYVYQLEKKSLEKKLLKLNKKWQKMRIIITEQKDKLAKIDHPNQESRKATRSFNIFLDNLEDSNDIEIKIKVITELVEKIKNLDFELKNKPLHRQIILIYETILSDYLDKFSVEIEYWKIQNQIANIQRNLSQIVARLNY